MNADQSGDEADALVRRALYVVATPLGNLGDLSHRALQVLRNADVIAAEDTRHSARLTHHFGIATRLMSYHDFSSAGREQAVLQLITEGGTVALISDAGTPLISDPGYRLVSRARELGIQVIPVPGPSALTAALSVAGLPTDRFSFEGFPPARSSARRQFYQAVAGDVRTLVFYESPHRILASVQDMAAVFGDNRQAVICRELTKTWETVYADTLGALVQWLQSDDNHCRGEFVVLLHGAEKTVDEELSAEQIRILGVLLRELPLKKAAALAAEITDGKKNLFYRQGLEMKMAKQ